jgi:hypothetical protein
VFGVHPAGGLVLAVAPNHSIDRHGKPLPDVIARLQAVAGLDDAVDSLPELAGALRHLPEIAKKVFHKEVMGT